MSELICNQCLHTGLPKKVARGSRALNTFCWMIFPIGLPYNLWRMMTKQKVCKQCGNDTLVDTESILGRKLVDRFINEGMGLDPNLSHADIIKAKVNTIPEKPKPVTKTEEVAPPPSVRRDPNIPYVDGEEW